MNGGCFLKFPVEGRPKLRRRRKTKATPGASSSTTREASGKEEATREGSIASGSQDTVTNGPSSTSGHLTSPSSGIGPHRRSRRRMRTDDPLGHYSDWANPHDQLSPTASVTYSGSPRSPGSRSSLSSAASSPMRSRAAHSPQSSLELRRNAVSTNVASTSFSGTGTENLSVPLALAHTWPMLPQGVQEVQTQIAFGGTGPTANDTHLLNSITSRQYSSFGPYLPYGASSDQVHDPNQFHQTQRDLLYSQTSHSFPPSVDVPHDPHAQSIHPPVAVNWATTNTFSRYTSGPFAMQDASFYQPNVNSLGPSTFRSLQVSPLPYLDLELASSSSHASYSAPHTPEVAIPDANHDYLYDGGRLASSYNCMNPDEPRNPIARSTFGQSWPNNLAN